MRLSYKNQSGFTLIEMLMGIIMLGILAMIIIPQISVSTEDAKLSILQANLSEVRNAIETYYAQHDSTYPGEKKNDGSANPNNSDSKTAFLEQLTQYTTLAGVVQNFKDGTYKYGSYIKRAGLPKNPFTNTNDVTCDVSVTNIMTRTADGGNKAWKFYPKTGVFIANNRAAHAVY